MTPGFFFLLLVIGGLSALALGLAWWEHVAIRREQAEQTERVLRFYTRERS